MRQKVVQISKMGNIPDECRNESDESTAVQCSEPPGWTPVGTNILQVLPTQLVSIFILIVVIARKCSVKIAKQIIKSSHWERMHVDDYVRDWMFGYVSPFAFTGCAL